MIELPYKPWMSVQAATEAEEMGQLNRSLTRGEGNIAGCLAEIVLAEFLKADRVSKEEKEFYHYDLLKNKQKIEVKTKRRTKDPLPHYEVSIATTSLHQQPDIYAFISITFKNKKGRGLKAVYTGVKAVWLCGFITREGFFNKAKFIPKGKFDISNGFRAHHDMYNLAIKDLYDDLKTLPTSPSEG